MLGRGVVLVDLFGRFLVSSLDGVLCVNPWAALVTALRVWSIQFGLAVQNSLRVPFVDLAGGTLVSPLAGLFVMSSLAVLAGFISIMINSNGQFSLQHRAQSPFITTSSRCYWEQG